jgi:hypothetical protein
VTALTELADWLDEQLDSEQASRQHLAEHALARIRDIAEQERQAPGTGLGSASPETIRQAFRDAIAHQREHRAVEDWPGQVGIYQKTARDLGLDLGDTSAQAGPVTDPSGRQLDEGDVATLQDALSEALAAVSARLAGWCDACMESADGVCGEHAGDTARAEVFRDLAERLGAPGAAAGARADEAAALPASDVNEVIAGLELAAAALLERAGQHCDACSVHPAGCCEEHANVIAQASSYRALAARLGGAR